MVSVKGTTYRVDVSWVGTEKHMGNYVLERKQELHLKSTSEMLFLKCILKKSHGKNKIEPGGRLGWWLDVYL